MVSFLVNFTAYIIKWTGRMDTDAHSIDSFILSTNRVMEEQTVLLNLEGAGEDRECFRQMTHPL